MIVDLTNQETGFCDRLRQVAFCIAVADLRGDRVLHVKERLTPQGPFSFLGVCEVDGFEVRPWSADAGSADVAMRVDGHPDLGSVRRYRPRGLGVDDARLLHLWLDAYRRLRPTPALQAKVDDIEVGAASIGVHLRWTDKVDAAIHRKSWKIYPRERASIERALSMLIRWRARGRTTPEVFLAADDRDAKEDWARRLRGEGFRVVMHEATFHPGALRQTSGEDFIVDLFALARCGEILGTTPSNVVSTADWISGRRRSVFAANLSPRFRLRLLGDALRRTARRWWA
ncbi:MAG TPA: hypothetical protein VF701_04145 [Thermoanaerobaculia bacterium]